MNQKQQCKIVQDLLPNYIENLTDEETNKFIEEHIRTCEECREMLEDMQNDLLMETKEPKKKTNPLRKLKNRYIITIIISIIVTVLIVIGVIYFRDNYKIQQDENGNLQIKRYSIDEKIMANCRHVIINGRKEFDNTEDGYIHYTYILSINEEGKCVNARVKENGIKKEKIDKILNDRLETKNITHNQYVDGNSIIYNNSNYLNQNINVIIEMISKYVEIEEIQRL